MEHTVVFDLDGTLADTAPDMLNAVNILLEKQNILPIKDPHARLMAGMGAKNLIEYGYRESGRSVSRDQADSLLAEYMALYAQNIGAGTTLFPGALDAVKRLHKNGWRLSICTNKLESLAMTVIEHLGISQYFHALLGGDTLAVRKPDPLHILETITRAGGTAAQSVMIGDTATDYHAARNARIPIVLARFGYSPEPVHTLGADALIDHFDQLESAVQIAFVKQLERSAAED